MRKLLGMGLTAVMATSALAGEVPVEVKTLEGAQVSLHVYPFLSEEDLFTLRLVSTNTDALAVFVPGDKARYAALALAPKDGFLKKGELTDTASALSDFPDAEAAAKAATEACDAKRGKKGEPCVVVLEVGPAK